MVRTRYKRDDILNALGIEILYSKNNKNIKIDGINPQHTIKICNNCLNKLIRQYNGSCIYYVFDDTCIKSQSELLEDTLESILILEKIIRCELPTARICKLCGNEYHWLDLCPHTLTGKYALFNQCVCNTCFSRIFSERGEICRQ